ncbi:hypothetical protein KJ742_07620 [Patescibacteria group bacterium]|nr:hypothetical protein [Patescibacteria group bacterium]MBU1683779.1 hypothetical protein [Patescibacteria group bacterium]MBU1934629.1 hypothetical protein [Patescibacteria group bacterium]
MSIDRPGTGVNEGNAETERRWRAHKIQQVKWFERSKNDNAIVKSMERLWKFMVNLRMIEQITGRSIGLRDFCEAIGTDISKVGSVKGSVVSQALVGIWYPRWLDGKMGFPDFLRQLHDKAQQNISLLHVGKNRQQVAKILGVKIEEEPQEPLYKLDIRKWELDKMMQEELNAELQEFVEIIKPFPIDGSLNAEQQAIVNKYWIVVEYYKDKFKESPSYIAVPKITEADGSETTGELQKPLYALRYDEWQLDDMTEEELDAEIYKFADLFRASFPKGSGVITSEQNRIAQNYWILVKYYEKRFGHPVPDISVPQVIGVKEQKEVPVPETRILRQPFGQMDQEALRKFIEDKMEILTLMPKSERANDVRLLQAYYEQRFGEAAPDVPVEAPVVDEEPEYRIAMGEKFVQLNEAVHFNVVVAKTRLVIFPGAEVTIDLIDEGAEISFLGMDQERTNKGASIIINKTADGCEQNPVSIKGTGELIRGENAPEGHFNTDRFKDLGAKKNDDGWL